MDAFLLIGLYILVFVGLPIAIGCLIYFAPKKLGYPKTGKYLTIIFGLFILAAILSAVFEDQLFTNNNAKELVEEYEVLLTDKFDLKENKSMSGIGDYYHTFTLKISERDKNNAILKIKDSDNFKINNASIESLLHQQQERYFGPRVIQNYETENSYIREYFQPSGRRGYAPTFRRISISKTENELIFEDIKE
ncbi:hypothetical protein [Hymenobacter daecheongensis]|uniref:hypothetical protein n=1 Tax=Hymenobacter daecheongensis TaxID=496053 RepID=UPI0009326E97|nr:hypothetical protein [Hymenobacter daecheongensis]